MLTIGSLTGTEIDDLIQQLCETVASQQEWQLSEDGILYRVEGDLIVLLALFYSGSMGRPENVLKASLQYKMFADDELFWEILDNQYEEQKKLDIRINGAFAAPFLRVLDQTFEIKDWSPEDLEKKFNPSLRDIENNVHELIAKVQTEQDHQNMIEIFIEEYFREHPMSSDSSPYCMQILSAIRTSQWSIAEDIIRQRLATERYSGVSTEKGSFYELAYQYLYSNGRTSSEEAPMVMFKSRRKPPNFEAMEKSVSEMMTDTIDNFGEDDESLYWIEILLLDKNPDRHAKLLENIGGWLGQYLVRQLDGAWSKTALGWGVSVGPGIHCYPYTQVEKYLQSGQSESLCQFVEECRQIVEVR